jgi:putative serine protease PepD
MADDERRDSTPERQADPSEDTRYFGPFAARSSQDEPTQILTGAGPADTAYPAPPGVPPLQPLPAEQVVSARRPFRHGVGVAVLLGAALLALVVGGVAGFGGARLAARTAVPDRIPPPAPPSVAASESAPEPTLPSPSPLEPASEPPSPVPAPPRQLDTVAVARAVLPGTVMIRASRNGSGTATGSGFVLDGAGRIMTNNHVVARAADGGRITVTFADGRRVGATLIGRSPSYDIAIVQVASGRHVRPIAVGNSDASQVGEPVIAVGSPLGLPGTVTQGIISAKNRPVVVTVGGETDAYINGIQTDAPINPGNSGGPLIDAAGRVIGVNSAILTLSDSEAQAGNIGLGFAIPIRQAYQVGRELIREGKATYPVIGADPGDESTAGVRLNTVEDGGPAARAGLRANDLITAIDGQRVSTREELIVAIRTHRPGEKVRLSYERGSNRGRAVVTLGSREG